jgi:PadR family transcriptional regulator PadR
MPPVTTQLRRGVLEFCVLALLAKEDRYGFDIAKSLSTVRPIAVSEGTVYPLLSRLRKEGAVTTSWRESDAGPPRKYYAITPQGRRALAEFTEEWTTFCDAVDSVLRGGTP